MGVFINDTTQALPLGLFSAAVCKMLKEHLLEAHLGCSLNCYALQLLCLDHALPWAVHLLC